MPEKSFWRMQAEAQKEASQQRGQASEEQAKEFLTKLFEEHARIQQRVARLAIGFADRCARVHELMGLYRQEWERAEAAEARIAELEAQAANATEDCNA
jgi:hypothetical protein